MSAKKRKRHGPEEIVRELRDADAMLTAGKDLSAVLQALEVSEATYHRWRNQYGGMKSEEAKRLKLLEDENRRLKQLVADLSLDNQMLKHVASGNPRGGRVGAAVNSSAHRPRFVPRGAMGRGPALRGSVRRWPSFKDGSRSPSEGRARCWSNREVRSGMKRRRNRMSQRSVVGCVRSCGSDHASDTAD